MLKPSRWPKWAQWSAIPAALTVTVLFGNAVEAFDKFDPLMPATRGFTRGYVTVQLAQAQQQAGIEYESISRNLGQLSSAVHAMRVESLDDKLSRLQYQRLQLEDLAEKSGSGSPVRAMLIEHDNKIAEIHRRLKLARCKLEGPDRANC